MQNNNQGNVPINFEVKLPKETKNEFGYTPSEEKVIEKTMATMGDPKSNGAWKAFVESNKLAEKESPKQTWDRLDKTEKKRQQVVKNELAEKAKDKKHLTKLYIHGMENSQEPVIKNPVLRKALEAKPKKSVNYLSDNYSFAENFKKQSKNIKDYKPKPSSVVRVASTMDDEKKHFDKLKEKGVIPLKLDFDKWLDEKEEFDLSSPELDSKKKQRDEMKLSNALQKIDMTMSGIMSTLNLAGGGKVVDLSSYRKSKEPASVKEINLADYFKVGMSVAELTPSERQLVNDLLRRTLGKNPK